MLRFHTPLSTSLQEKADARELPPCINNLFGLKCHYVLGQVHPMHVFFHHFFTASGSFMQPLQGFSLVPRSARCGIANASRETSHQPPMVIGA